MGGVIMPCGISQAKIVLWEPAINASGAQH
jgi:hypothetical protein